MKTVLICHHDEPLNRYSLARWLASFSDLRAVIEIREPGGRLKKRIQREIERVGWVRFFDVLAFRFYYKFFLAERDRAWEHGLMSELEQRYPAIPSSTKILVTSSPNSPEVEKLLSELKPDISIARCKNILKKTVFGAPSVGTFVMHPGICPEYRNAHGCFWAMANRDLGNVGMTLLRVDPGVDTGPVFGYYRCQLNEGQSHIVTQARVVFDNLDAIRGKLIEIAAGTAQTIDTTGRKSAVWGQPWLTKYLSWKSAAGQPAR